MTATTPSLLVLCLLAGCALVGLDERISDGQARIDAILADAGIADVTEAELACGQPMPGSLDCHVTTTMTTDDLADLGRFDAVHRAIGEIAVYDVGQSEEDPDSAIRLELSYGDVTARIFGRSSPQQVTTVLDAAPDTSPVEELELHSNQVTADLPESTPFPDLCATADTLAGAASLGGRAVIVAAGLSSTHRVLIADDTHDTTALCARLDDYLTTIGTGHTEDVWVTVDGDASGLRIEFADDASLQAFTVFWGDAFPDFALDASVACCVS